MRRGLTARLSRPGIRFRRLPPLSWVALGVVERVRVDRLAVGVEVGGRVLDELAIVQAGGDPSLVYRGLPDH